MGGHGSSAQQLVWASEMLMTAICLCWGRQDGCQDSQLWEQRVGRTAAELSAVGIRIHRNEPACPLYAPGEWAVRGRAVEPRWQLKNRTEVLDMEKQDIGSNPCSAVHLLCKSPSHIHLLTFLLAKLVLIQGFYTLVVSPAKNLLP